MMDGGGAATGLGRLAVHDVLEMLRYQGYQPRTFLDVGAHVGDFTRTVLKIFPDCRPTLIEPNPFCQEDLAKLPWEVHAFAASDQAGLAEMFLSKQWLQSTGSSLYRENSHYFNDDLVIRREVGKVRIDDAFAGRRFDFVKIDTQGSELDVLRGGEQVIRQADYILVEVSLQQFNLGAPRPEAVFAQLESMGFRCCDVLDFHRLEDVQDDQLLQMDFLFERKVKRPCQGFRYAPLHGHDRLMRYLQWQKRRSPDFSILDVGAAANPWSAEVLDASFDMNPTPVAPLHFTGDLNDARSWEPLLRHVSRHGRFSYCICSHTLEDLAYPTTTLEMLPRVAEAGYVAVPSRYLECLKPEGPYRGFIHHRWILDGVGEELVLAPKIPLVEHLALAGEAAWAEASDRFELQMFWRGAIAFNTLNGDYLGPDRSTVINLYARFLDRP